MTYLLINKRKTGGFMISLALLLAAVFLTLFGASLANASGPGAPTQRLEPAAATGGRIDTAIAVARATCNRQRPPLAGDVEGPPTAGAAPTPIYPVPQRECRSVVIADDTEFADAFAGTPFAAANDAPILLNERATSPAAPGLNPAVATVLPTIVKPGSTVYIMGGNVAISDKTASDVAAMGYTVVRIGGLNRYGTAADIATAMGSPVKLLLASGVVKADAIGAGPAAYKDGRAILLSDPATLSSETAAYLGTPAAKNVITIGGASAISAAVHSAAGSIERVEGADRYETAVNVAVRFFPASAWAVSIANGETLIDGLVGGADAAWLGIPLLLVAPPPSTTVEPSIVRSYIVTNKVAIFGVIAYGGTGAISAATLHDAAMAAL